LTAMLLIEIGTVVEHLSPTDRTNVTQMTGFYCSSLYNLNAQIVVLMNQLEHCLFKQMNANELCSVLSLNAHQDFKSVSHLPVEQTKRSQLHVKKFPAFPQYRHEKSINLGM